MSTWHTSDGVLLGLDRENTTPLGEALENQLDAWFEKAMRQQRRANTKYWWGTDKEREEALAFWRGEREEP